MLPIFNYSFPSYQKIKYYRNQGKDSKRSLLNYGPTPAIRAEGTHDELWKESDDALQTDERVEEDLLTSNVAEDGVQGILLGFPCGPS